MPPSLERRPSRLEYLDSKGQKLDVRAHQRTYQGAYVRTCLGCLTFSLLVMKLFSKEFMPLGMVYQVYALLLCLVALLRSRNTDIYFINFNDPNWHDNYEIDPSEADTIPGSEDQYYFKTSGNVVLWLILIGFGCYITLFILLTTV
ncbi:DEKNAAC100043 [Brettanomyces naardenensis]|uniref:DEKNAAC100043 n=1 Tax=Brettanomyces naardenensis TaxID=13370 RepID=A0A448YGA2_BRENA|nr:DEKNAAC100043 [Brettanomyces naardenensis]